MTTKAFDNNVNELKKLRQKTSFRFESWVNNKKQILTALSWSLDIIIGNEKEYPAWNSEFSLGEIPWIAKQGDTSKQKAPVDKAVYQSWPDYFQKQKHRINVFKKTGEMKPVCEELVYWVSMSKIAGDRKAFFLLKQYADLILEILDNVDAATDREHFTYKIDSHDRNLSNLFYYISGWQRIEAIMLPSYEVGERRRAQISGWSRGCRDHDKVSARNEAIREEADRLREQRGHSTSSIAKLLSAESHEFLTSKGKHLSVRQIRKIISITS